MKTYLLNLWDNVRTSYWFVPTIFAVGSLVLSFVMPLLDAAMLDFGPRLPAWMQTTTETARATLSAMAGAMVAVTGTVFSITIVTLSLTSQQFGPRLLRRFMYDLPTQITLGVFLSTGFYCLLLLRVVEHHDSGAVAPHLSVFLAVVLTVLSMAMLIVFIHHVAILIQAPHVVASVAQDLDDAIVRLFPDPRDESSSEQPVHAPHGRQAEELGEADLVARSTLEGYIQAIDYEGLLYLACNGQLVLRLHVRPGDFISLGTVLADVWRSSSDSDDGTSGEALGKRMNETIIVGVRRTPRQDVECAVDELVEVAVRSLSPGVNDPFTAMNCIDRLSASVGRFVQRKLPPARYCDDDGQLRVITRPISFADMLDTAFNQIRQYSRDSVAVTIRLLEAFSAIAEHIHEEEERTALFRHAQLIAANGESFTEYDRASVSQRLRDVQVKIGDSGGDSRNPGVLEAVRVDPRGQ